MLFSTGLMFPLSMGLSNLLKADWKFEGNPLGKLGVFLNIAQLVYFPILFWAIGKSPEEAIIFFSIITAAHFFPLWMVLPFKALFYNGSNCIICYYLNWMEFKSE